MKALRAIWRRIVRNYSAGGARQVLERIIAKPLSAVFSQSSWLIYRIGTREYDRVPRLILAQKPLTLDSMVAHGYEKARLLPDRIQARIEAGHRCFGFFDGESLANIGWVCSGLLVLEPFKLELKEADCSAIYDCVTFPEHRSKGIYTDTLIRLVSLLRSEGAATVLIAVDPGNVMSIKGIERAGFVPHFKLVRYRRWGRDRFERVPFLPLYTPAR